MHEDIGRRTASLGPLPWYAGPVYPPSASPVGAALLPCWRMYAPRASARTKHERKARDKLRFSAVVNFK